MSFVKHKSVKGNNKSIESDKKFIKSFVFFVDFSTVVGSVWVVRVLWVVLSVGKIEFGVRMGGIVDVGGVLAGGLGLGNTVVGLVGALIGLLHLGRCLGAGIVVGLSEGGIVVVGGNVVIKALGGKVDVVVCMCGNVAVGGIVGISVKVTVGGIVGVSGKVAVGCVVIISGEVVVGGIVGISIEVIVGGIFSFVRWQLGLVMSQLVWVLVVLLFVHSVSVVFWVVVLLTRICFWIACGPQPSQQHFLVRLLQ